MFIILKKNLNTLILVFFLHISFVGLKSFVSFNNEKSYVTSSITYPKLTINTISRDKMLIKKEIQSKPLEATKELEVATYNNTDFHTDYKYNEMDIDLTLVPVGEKILFSGIPVPMNENSISI